MTAPMWLAPWIASSFDDSVDEKVPQHARPAASARASEQFESEQSEEDRLRLQRLRANDVAALEELHRAHYADLVGFAHALLGIRDAAVEAVQDVFVSLWDRRADVDVAGSVRGYLFAAVRYRVLNAKRAERAVERLTERVALDASDPVSARVTVTPEEASIRSDRAAILHRALAQLSGRQREALLLRYKGELSFDEVGAVMGVSADAARKLVGRATVELRSLLAPYLTDG